MIGNPHNIPNDSPPQHESLPQSDSLLVTMQINNNKKRKC